MLRKLTAVLALGFVVACVSAKEYKGTVTKIDTDKHTITAKVDGEDKTFGYTDSTEFMRQGRGGKEAKAIPSDKLGIVAERVAEKGAPATIVTDEKDGKEVVKGGKPVASKVTIGGGKKG